MTEVLRAIELLEDAYTLLADARCDASDPALRRSWGQRRRRWTDAVRDFKEDHYDELDGQR